MVLPKDLMEEVQSYYCGGYLWIEKIDRSKRDNRIRELKKQGFKSNKIALQVGLSARRVRQIS